MGTLTHLTPNGGLPATIRLDLASRSGAHMIDGYLFHMQRRRRSPKTIRLRLFYLRKFAAWYGGDLTTAQHDDLERYVFDNPHWSENTQATAASTLKSFYGWATREGILTLNPARDMPNIHPRRRRPRIASEAAISHALETTAPTDRAMVMLGAECGLRLAEIASLNRADRDGEWLHILGKGRQQRTVHLSHELQTLLDLLEQTTMRFGNYFPGRNPREHLHETTVWRHITEALQSNPHSLRRRAGTVVYRKSGNDIHLAQYFLGHKSPDTTAEYLDVGDDDLRFAGSLTRLAA